MIMLKRGSQPGYTLVELLVTMAILGLVASAVAGVYQVSQQTYTRASSLEAAQVGARAGLDRMANELRLIGSYWLGRMTRVTRSRPPPLPASPLWRTLIT